jgi:broad specificity phosphatase PhoE
VGYLNRVSLWQLTRDVGLDAIYTSERLRSRRTAELVARQHRLTIRARDELNEIDPGIAVGICFAQMAPHKAGPGDKQCVVRAKGSRPQHAMKLIQKYYREQAAKRLKGRFPLGESLEDVARRTKPFTDELQRGLQGTTPRTLVVGHGVVNRALLHHLMGWSLQSVAWLRQENDQVYRLEMADLKHPRLFLYTPGVGWRACLRPPQPQQKYLDCNPLADKAGQPPPASQPSAPPASRPAPATQPGSGG